MELRWTPEALNDLREIEAGGFAEVVDRVLARAGQIEAFPNSGRSVPEYQSPLVRELIERPYRILYELFPDRIEVIAIIHGARELPTD